MAMRLGPPTRIVKFGFFAKVAKNTPNGVQDPYIPQIHTFQVRHQANTPSTSDCVGAKILVSAR